MKRSERHHLKEDPVQRMLMRTRMVLEGRERVIVSVVVALVLVGAVVAGFLAWQGRADERANASLAEALFLLQAPVIPPAALDEDDDAPPAEQPPGTYPSETARLEAALPALLEVAATFPSTRAGIAARYHAAAALTGLERYDEAEERYREVIDQGRGRIHARMAHFGLAEAQARRGDYEAAIARYEEIAAGPEDGLPLDAVLMQLGRTYRMAGREADALQTFNRIVDEFPASLYVGEARRQIEELQGIEGA